MKQKYRNAGWIVLCLFLISVPLLSGRISPYNYEGGRSRDEKARELRNASAFGQMLGEFRTGLSDILLLKTERYLHGGVGYEPHLTEVIEAEISESYQQPGDDHEHSLSCAHSETLIPGEEQDYRGWVGDLHRQVKPWQPAEEEHKHAEAAELLPWFRVMTLSDPHHVKGYTVGGYWLSRENDAAAARFLEEGIRNNPNAFQLHLMLAKVYFNQAGDMEGNLFEPTGDQLKKCLEAKSSYRRAAERALRQRPHRQKEPDEAVWSQTDEEDAWGAFRMAVMTEKRYGSQAQAYLLGQKILNRAGDDPVLKRIVDTLETSSNYIPESLQRIIPQGDS